MAFRHAALLLSAALIAPVLAAGVVHKGTVVPVVLDTPVSSATSKVGDTVQATIAKAHSGFPEGTHFKGTLTNVVAKTDTLPGEIEAKITTAVLPGGKEVPVHAVPCSEKGEIRTVVKGKAPTERKKTQAAKLGAIAAILLAQTPEQANIQKGAEAGLARVGKPKEMEAPAGKKCYIFIQQEVKL